MTHLAGKKIVMVATDYFEEVELIEPRDKLQEMGAEVVVAAPHDGVIKALRHVEPGQEVAVDITLDQLMADDYDAVIIPGGVVNSDHLRVEIAAQDFVREMAAAGKTVAAICHGPWLLVSADLVEGKTLTSYRTLQDDIENAGGTWIDIEVQTDENFITSRKPKDIPAFVAAIANSLS